MKKLNYYFLSVFFFISICYPQSADYINAIGKFENASSFYINSAGVIFVTDISSDEIIQIDTLGNFINSLGGYGWKESTFDDPVDVYADALKVFVVDKNNHRIQQFDKNLNFSFQIKTRESENEIERFGYPLSAVMSNQGDIFILDSENSRIEKFDIFGNFILNFGGYDYGNYALKKPGQLAVSMNNNIFVIDGNEVFIFDQYGNGIGKISGESDFKSIRIIFNKLILTTEHKIYSSDLLTGQVKITEVVINGLEEISNLVSALQFKEKLYILTKSKILIFNISN